MIIRKQSRSSRVKIPFERAELAEYNIIDIGSNQLNDNGAETILHPVFSTPGLFYTYRKLSYFTPGFFYT